MFAVVVVGTSTGAVRLCAVRRMRGCLSDPIDNQIPSISPLTFFFFFFKLCVI